MESLSMVIILLSVGVYSWAVLGLIKPVSAGLPNRWASVPVWIGSVVLFIIGASFIEDGDNTPASSASSVPQASALAELASSASRAPELNAVAEPAEITCADWNSTAFFNGAELSDVTRCLETGADLNTRDDNGYTPLHRAAESRNPEAVTALLEAGADPHARGRFGRTPLHVAKTDEAVTALLEAGADLEAQGVLGTTPLYLAAGSGPVEVMTVLLEAGADPNAHEVGDTTLLHSAAAGGNVEAVMVLLMAGADLEARDYFGVTPLHSAARTGAAETVMVLLEAGANLNARDEDGRTPLHTAALWQKARIVKALLERGVDPNARGKFGHTPLHRAVLRQRGTADAEIVIALLEAGANPNARTEEGYTPLHSAARDGPAEVVMILLEAGANPNARTEGGYTPLQVAAGRGPAEVVMILLEAGANPNARDEEGYTPLHSAARDGPAEVVMMLLEAGANPAARTNLRELPVEHAEDNEQLRGTDAYWKLNAARFQSREMGEGVFDVGGDPITTPTRRQASVPSPPLPQHPLDRALYLRDEITRYVVEPCAMWLTQLQVPIKPDVPVDVLTQINELEAHMLFGNKRMLVAVATEMETRAARLRFYEEEKSQCIELLARRHGLLSMAASSPVDLGTDYGNAVVGVREPEADASATRSSSVGDPITTPTLLTQVLREYSEEAHRAKYEGTVILETIVRQDGTVDVVRVARSLRFGLNEQAIEAVRQWRFQPGMRNGEPVDVELKIEVNFNLRSAGFSR